MHGDHLRDRHGRFVLKRQSHSHFCSYISLTIVAAFAEGECPGLDDDDLTASEATLKMMSEQLDAECTQLRIRQEKNGRVAEYLIRKRNDDMDFSEVRFALLTIMWHILLLVLARHLSSIVLLMQGCRGWKCRRRKKYVIGSVNARRAGQRTRFRSTETVPPQTRDGNGSNE